jgi:GNAT superfamily N-acetyltransferase
MSELMIRAAVPEELKAVESLLVGASTWLSSRGIDQWQYPPHRDRITSAIARGDCFLAFREGAEEPLATIQVDDFADPEFWTASDGPDQALYVHRMAVCRDVAGQGLGSELLEWAAKHAAARGKRFLRLDAWKDNPGLHRYYEGEGFRLVRVVDLPHRRSGALFERPT